MVNVFTSRVNYEGADKLDTTVQSGEGLGSVLAPTWGLVGGHKHFEAQQNQDSSGLEKWGKYKPLSAEDYTDGYLKLLRTRYAADKQPFLDILNRDRVTLTCYCGANDFCHRHIAVDVLEKIADHHVLPFEPGGELDPRTGRILLPKEDPERQEISFGVAPIIAPNGTTPLGFAALARVSQDNRQAALEVAHFGIKGQERAKEYVEHLEKSLIQRGYAIQGRTPDIQGAVGWLTELSQNNRLIGEWSALSQEQRQCWQEGNLSLTHSYNQVKPVTGVDLNYSHDVEW